MKIEQAFIIDDHLLISLNLILRVYILLDAQHGIPPTKPLITLANDTQNVS